MPPDLPGVRALRSSGPRIPRALPWLRRREERLSDCAAVAPNGGGLAARLQPPKPMAGKAYRRGFEGVVRLDGQK